jgi:hypothetical protein
LIWLPYEVQNRQPALKNMDSKEENVIGPTKELKQYMERLKKQPPASPEKMEAQLRACKKIHESKEYRDEERFVRANWRRLAEAWNRLPERKDENYLNRGDNKQ